MASFTRKDFMNEVSLPANFNGLDCEELKYLSENLRKKIPIEVLQEAATKEVWMRKKPERKIKFHSDERFKPYVVFYADTLARISEIEQFADCYRRST